ncbi:Dynein heavy chain 9 axonemal [Dissostichus eleginoides]|uniref:Dynein heavy chain 9 axonemal n=1 Tax=Dissostichus eleginoides TaxID=100907 RepID=A0AAD9CVW6_DISEL|nr:Dynein heavy chain 9 axonemal [Dissostichus eleginoides]
MSHQLLKENPAKLTAKFEKATAVKLKCQQEAESTACTISLANCLCSLATDFLNLLDCLPLTQHIQEPTHKHGHTLDLAITGDVTVTKTHTLELGMSDHRMVLLDVMSHPLDPGKKRPMLHSHLKSIYIKIGDKECEYFLILHTKPACPHYQPELQAQCTLINFSVTRGGLVEQLLAATVSMERPDLEQLKYDLTKQQNGFKITLKTLEDSLLSRLSLASGNFLVVSVNPSLSVTAPFCCVFLLVKEAKVTEARINEARELYKPAAARASLLYFIMNYLNKIHPMYQFSLKAFRVVFQRAVLRAEPGEALKQRLSNLTDSITSSVFQYTTRGLFECDKLTYSAQLTFQILLMNKEINPAELDFLLRYPVQPAVISPTTPGGGSRDSCNGME